MPAGGRYLYELVNEETLYVDDRCPIDKPLYESEESTEPLHIYTLASTHLKESAYWKNSKTPEISSIKIDKFGAFTYSTSALVHEVDEVDRCFYQEADYCDNTLIKCTEESIDAYAYEWRDSSVILNSFERSQDSYYLDSLNIRFRIRNEDGHREIGIGYNTDDYSTEIDVYKDVVQKYRDINGFEEEAVVSVKVGTFYVIDDWNASETTPQDIASLINTGINNVDLLETMEKCIATKTFAIDADKNVRCSNYRYDPRYKNKALTVFIDPKTMRPYEPNTTSYLTEDGVNLQGNFAIIRQNDIYYKWCRKVSDGLSSLGYQIIVDADHFPGTYKIVGETYARSRNDGQDKHYQFEIPLCKLSVENNITLEAAGDPTTFTMNFKVLRKEDGTMIKLTQYGETVSRLEEYLPPLPDENPSEPGRGAYRAIPVSKTYSIINPDENTIQYTDVDIDAPLDGSSTGHANKADTEFIESITEETSKSWPESEIIPDITLTSQEITPEGEALLETNIDEVLVREQTNYDIEQEKTVVYADGTTVPTGEWEKVDEYTSNRFLAPDEYALEANAEANSR